MKNFFKAAAIFLVLLLVGAFLIGAPAFESGEIEAAAQTLDFREATPATVETVQSTPESAFIVFHDQTQSHAVQITTPLDNQREVIAAEARPFNAKRMRAQGLARPKFI